MSDGRAEEILSVPPRYHGTAFQMSDRSRRRPVAAYARQTLAAVESSLSADTIPEPCAAAREGASSSSNTRAWTPPESGSTYGTSRLVVRVIASQNEFSGATCGSDQRACL